MVLKNISKKGTAVIFFALLFSCNNKPKENKSESQTEQPKKENPAKILFENNCSACHGNDGTAGISGAANLQSIKMKSDSIEITIANGKRNMPSFKTILTEKEIKQLTEYAKNLHQ